MRQILVLVALVAASIAPPAALALAAPKFVSVYPGPELPSGEPRVRSAISVAKRVARATYPTACEPRMATSITMGDSTMATAYRGRYLGSNRRACHVFVNPRYMAGASWQQLCRTIVHEWGHLAGRKHQYHAEASNVAYFSYTTKPWRPCGKDWRTHPLRYMTSREAKRVRYCPDQRFELADRCRKGGS